MRLTKMCLMQAGPRIKYMYVYIKSIYHKNNNLKILIK